MTDPTRFPAGVCDQETVHSFGDVNFLDPSKWFTYWDDFTKFTAADWVITETDAGATQALTSTPAGGNLLITNTAADNDLVSMQPAGASVPFLLDLTKKAFFRVKFRTSSATECGIMFGLVPIDTAPFDLATSSAVTAGIYFFKADGVTTVLGHVENADTISATSAVGTLVADTNTEWAWFYNGATAAGNRSVDFFIDNVKVASITDMTNFPTVGLTLIMAHHDGDGGGAKTITIDHIMASVER